MNAKSEVEAAVLSIYEKPEEGTAIINLRWESDRQISDFDLHKLGRVLNSENETEHSGWALVEQPVKVTVGGKQSAKLGI